MGVNPAMTATLASLFQQQGQPGAPPQAPGTTPPIVPPPGAPGPSAGGMQDFANLASQERQQILSSPPAQEAAREREASQTFAGQAAGTPLPQLGPHIEKGRGFLHNLGQALQMVSLATGPGREIFGPSGPVYGPGIAQYRATQAGLMGREQAARQAAEESGKEVTAIAGVSKPAIYAAGRERVAEMTTKQRADQAMMQHGAALQRIAAMRDIAAQNNAMRAEVTRMRDETMQSIAAAGNVTKEDVAGMMVSSAQTILNTKEAQDLGPAFTNVVKSIFGLGGIEAPGGASPVTTGAPPAKRGAAPPAKGASKPPAGTKFIGTGKDGKDHYLDAQHKDLGPVK